MGILALGIITSYTDIKYGKIKNNIIILTLIFAVLSNLILILKLNPNVDYIIQTVSNILSALFVGYLLWDIGLWTAGDGKLFLAYASLIPIYTYNSASYIPFFQSMNIMINTFVPIFLFLFIHLIITTPAHKIKKSLKKSLNLKQATFLGLTIFSFLWVTEIISEIIGIKLNFFLYVLLLFVLIAPLEKLMSRKFYLLLIAISLVRIFFDKSIFTLDFLKGFLSIALIFIFLRYFILELGFAKFTTPTPINRLKEGMVPAEMIYEKEKRYKKKKMLFFSFFSYLKEKNNKSILDVKSEGLTRKDIEKIEKLAKKHPDLKTFQIQQTLPFAPFLFMGAILTIIAKGNIFIFIKFLFS